MFLEGYQYSTITPIEHLRHFKVNLCGEGTQKIGTVRGKNIQWRFKSSRSLRGVE